MDHEFQLSVTKALHPSEAPLKTKHARSVIIATHRYKGAKLFWNIITRQPLMEHRFTAWKFCHVLHKVLREGHVNCVRHSQVHKTLILEVGKLWGHLQDGVGKCIESYTQLLVNKLDFHQKNMGIPGCITMDFNEIRKVMGDDLNNYFQLCVEIFDYLDCIIALQAVIFTAITTYRMSSMTPQGQCRLAPIVTLISDSNPLYDLCVRVLFLLHDGISHDILAGHRARFNDLFAKLKIFYETVRPLQYFADIIQLPQLPDSAPNFSSVHGVGNYIAPVMHVYQEEEEVEVTPVVEASLLDLSNVSDNNGSSGDVPEEEVVDASQIMIANLQEELRVRQMHIDQLVNVTREMSNLRVRNEALESEIHVTKEMLKNTNEIKDNLELKLKEMEELQGEIKEGDEKYKKEVEKLDKFKTMYAKLREEHITLLRGRNDDSKLLMAERKKCEELQTEVNNLKAQVEDNTRKTEEQLVDLNTKLKERDAEAAKKSLKLQELESELAKTKNQFEKQDLDKSAMINEYKNQMEEQRMELKKLKENYDLEVKTKQHEMNELLQTKAINEISLRDVHNQLDIVCKEKADLSEKLSHMEHEMQLKTQTHDQNLKEKQMELKSLMEIKIENENKITNLQEQLQSVNKAKEELEVNISQLNQTIGHTNGQLEEANQKLAISQTNESQTKTLIEELVASLHKSLASIMENDFKFDYFELMTIPDISDNNVKQIQSHLQNTLANYKNGNVKLYMESYIQLTHALKVFHEHIMLIFSNTTDLTRAEELRNMCNELRLSVVSLYQMMQAKQDANTIENISINQIMPKLNTIQMHIRSLQNTFSESLNVGDMLQQELRDMDSIIEEATRQIMDLLLNTKSQHEGIQLEVNEKILDSCTNLMKCIVLLIQRSRELQSEIVANEKGSFTAKEFYKRNSQWTEGLISASKNIAKGAKFLVDAANKTIVSDSADCFELIVAAQDIAASTAQLVIASKVKAKNDSPKLANLTKASRDVSVATGKVVATVRDGNTKLEYKNEIDVSKLTPSQRKTMEMEMQIKVLQLEQSLQSEQQKLMLFRKAFYQSADED
ncbi:huntingtin interacting protein 1 [Haematobia irritans]|uniref:huntingtin interacting protein 1 n=1 Tax=Haematobia irritans TaxID=7368 RepID=UPI003F5012BB